MDTHCDGGPCRDMKSVFCRQVETSSAHRPWRLYQLRIQGVGQRVGAAENGFESDTALGTQKAPKKHSWLMTIFGMWKIRMTWWWRLSSVLLRDITRLSTLPEGSRGARVRQLQRCFSIKMKSFDFWEPAESGVRRPGFQQWPLLAVWLWSPPKMELITVPPWKVGWEGATSDLTSQSPMGAATRGTGPWTSWTPGPTELHVAGGAMSFHRLP